MTMRINQSFDEIRVYAGIAERTGVHFTRDSVRRSAGYCGNLPALVRKARSIGDGTFYLPIERWPSGTARLDLLKPWIVMSSH